MSAPQAHRRPERDTPLAAFYRIYQFLIADSKFSVRLRDELEYFCRGHPEWAVCDIPDPRRGAGVDEATYAAMAGLTRLMCAWFNRRIVPRAVTVVLDLQQSKFLQGKSTEVERSVTWETKPAWAGKVKPLREVVYVPDAEGNFVVDKDKDEKVPGPGPCIIMREMGIVMREPHIYFI